MSKLRSLGLVGGLGVGATVYYYKKLAEALGPSLDIVITHAQPSRVYEFVRSGDRFGLAEYLADYLRRLHSAGAEVAAIPAVTPHDCLDELRVISPLPLIDIFEPLIDELAVRQIRRVAVFGTRFVVESELFGRLGSVEFVQPIPEEMDYIHNTYTELAGKGYGTAKQFDGLTALAHKFCNHHGAEAIILAGTDLALLFHDSNADFPLLDCADLHIQAIAKALAE
jgi:aspartate racemase